MSLTGGTEPKIVIVEAADKTVRTSIQKNGHELQLDRNQTSTSPPQHDAVTPRFYSKQTVLEFGAEALGTFFLTVMVIGQALIDKIAPAAEKSGGPVAGMISNGLTVASAVYLVGGVSGAHINPVVSVAFATIGRLPWWKVPHYLIAQYLGGFLGGAAAYGLYYDGLHTLGPKTYSEYSAGGFMSMPHEFLTYDVAFLDPCIPTIYLMVVIMALGDFNNTAPVKGLMPLMVGLMVSALVGTHGANGLAINPARELGPRMFLGVAGWGAIPFKPLNYTWWWIHILGAHVGAIVGGYVYWILIEVHHSLKKS